MSLPSAYLDGVVLEDRPCPNGCAPADEAVLEGEDRLHGLRGRFRVVRCGDCGLMRTNPRPTAETIGAYYPSDYGPYQSTPALPKAKAPSWHRRFRARLNRWLGKDVRRLPDVAPGHLVEIGCASGAWLAEMRARGWSVEGVEFSEHAARTARALGLEVQTGSVESTHAPRRKADVLAAWMVLEHLHEPLSALRKLRGWVSAEGHLIGAVPDAGAFERRAFGEYWYGLHLPAHLYHYTPLTLRTLLDKAGWELVDVRWQPNCSNLLNSLEWMSEARGWPRVLRATRWAKNAPRAASLRKRLGWLLGVTRQSGRMEFHARPKRGLTRHAVRWWPHSDDPRVASYRLRCLRIVEALARQGVDAALYRPGRDAPPRVLVLSKRYDTRSLAAALALRERAGTHVLLDLCDNHFHVGNGDSRLLRRADELREAVRSVDQVIAASSALAEVIAAECAVAAPVTVIPDAPEPPFEPAGLARWRDPRGAVALARLQAALRRSGVPQARRLVWFGNAGSPGVEGGMGDLQRIRGALHDAHAAQPLSLTVISNDAQRFAELTAGWSLPAFYLPWRAGTFSRALRLHGAAVIPVGLNPFTRCKTSNRVATALLHGLNVIADGIPSYAEFADCAVLDDWQRGLGPYLADAPRRAADIAAGRQRLAQGYSLAAVSALWRAAVAPRASTGDPA